MTDRQIPTVSLNDHASDDHSDHQIADDRATDAPARGGISSDVRASDSRPLWLLAAPKEIAGRPDASPERPLAFAYLEIQHQDGCLRLRGLRCNCVPELVARWKPATRIG